MAISSWLADAAKVAQLHLSLDRILDLPDLIRREDLGEALGFHSIEADAQRAREILTRLRQSRADLLWNTKLDELQRVVTEYSTVCQSIQGFKPNASSTIRPTPFEQRDNLARLFGQKAGALFEVVVPVLGYIQQIDLDALRKSVQDTTEAARKKSEEHLSALSKLQEDADGILQTLRGTAGQVGVAEYAKIFGTEAKMHNEHAWGWAVTALVLGLLAAAYTMRSVEPHIRSIIIEANRDDSSPGLMIPLAVTRLVLVSMMYLGIIWCIRNFSASRHNSVVNRHRANALNTFEAFVKAASADAQTKNAVLLQTTQSIFSPQSSGYLKTDNEGPTAPSLIGIMPAVPKDHQ